MHRWVLYLTRCNINANMHAFLYKLAWMDILDLIVVFVRLLFLGGKIVHQYVTAVMTNNVTHTWMHKSKRYVDVLRDILRQTLNQFHSSLELIGPVFYDTLNKWQKYKRMKTNQNKVTTFWKQVQCQRRRQPCHRFVFHKT